MSFTTIANFYRLSAPVQRSVAERIGLTRYDDNTDQRTAAPAWMLRAKNNGLMEVLAQHVSGESL